MNTATSQNATVSDQHVEGRGTPSRLTLASTHGPGEERDARSARLTPRQLEVLALLCEGLPNKLICRRLDICAGTVKAHISSILRELGVSSRLQAVVAARRYGLVEDALEHTADGRHNGKGTATALAFSDRTAPRQFEQGHP
jgi:DNA-binding NarL/FixJ family response regulator